MKSIFLKKIKDEKGQNLVEFALILILLLALFFGIVEFARAWYRADKLKNAANIAARTYAVTKNWDNPGGAKFKAYTAMGTTAVTITTDPNPPVATATSIKVMVSETFRPVICPSQPVPPPPPGPLGGIMGLCGITINRDATYRLE